MKPEAKVEEPDEMQRARETSDVMWRLNNYKTITCDCGAKLRVPPRFKEPKIKCPHCGRIHQV
jgi:heat shock protein HtpX